MTPRVIPASVCMHCGSPIATDGERRWCVFPDCDRHTVDWPTREDYYKSTGMTPPDASATPPTPPLPSTQPAAAPQGDIAPLADTEQGPAQVTPDGTVAASSVEPAPVPKKRRGRPPKAQPTDK